MNLDISLPMSAERLVPHRLPLRLVDRLLEFSGSTGIVEAVIRPENIFLNSDGMIPSLTTVELIAQAAAAVNGYNDLIQEKPIKRGFLADIRGISFLGPCFKGDRLTIRIEIVRTFGEFSIIQGEVKRGEEVLTQGTLKLWVPEVGS
jgi:3-hydroxyacyl-[acyl-carrier-protein] dehydratase